MRLKYIASAMNHVFVGGIETIYEAGDDFTKEYSRITNVINTWDPNHSFGLLFNAYAEPRMGQVLNDFCPGVELQGDSGGLQMISLGHTPTPKLRAKVYEIQAKHASHSMCFDEIPLQKSGIVQFANLNSLLYDKAMVPSCAKQTALNIIEQVETFDRLGSKSKVYLIIQGNDFDTYQLWTDEILKNLPDDVTNKLHGIASGGGCIGNNTQEDVERFFTLSHLNAPAHLLKNFHLLGIGAPSRIVTLSALDHLFDKETNISYDSTKHTGGIIRAQVQIGHRIIAIGSRARNEKYMQVWKAFETFQHLLGYSYTEMDLYESIMMSAEERYAKHGQPKDNVAYTLKSNLVRYTVLALSIHNMFEVVRKVKEDASVKTKHAGEHLHSLKSITSVDSFMKWKAQYGKYFPSSRVQTTSNQSANLGDFFE